MESAMLLMVSYCKPLVSFLHLVSHLAMMDQTIRVCCTLVLSVACTNCQRTIAKCLHARSYSFSLLRRSYRWTGRNWYWRSASASERKGLTSLMAASITFYLEENAVRTTQMDNMAPGRTIKNVLIKLQLQLVLECTEPHLLVLNSIF